MSRNPIFAGSSVDGGGQKAGDFKLRPIDFLLALGSKEKEVAVLGVLIQLKNGQWYLEDSSNIVKLDLSKARFHEVSSLFVHPAYFYCTRDIPWDEAKWPL